MSINLPVFKKVLRVLRPRVEVGGLEISDTTLAYLSIDPESKKIVSHSLSLPVGIVIGGKVKKKAELVKQFSKLHDKITSHTNKNISVIVSCGDANVYTQTFLLPRLKGVKMEEAVDLNMEMVSPLDMDTSYHDWQEIRNYNLEPQGAVLASFVERKVVDSFVSALDAAHFSVVAIEQKAASVARLLSSQEASYAPGEPYFTLMVNSDGLSFSIIKDNTPRFNRFASWSEVSKQEGGQSQMSFQDFRNLVVRESHRVINYYTSHFSGSLKRMYLIAPGLEEKVSAVLKENFAFQVQIPQLKTYKIQAPWLVVLGTALRGIIPRVSDEEISLAPEGTEEKFRHSQIFAFIELWRNILATVFVVILVASLGVFIFLNSYQKSIIQDLAGLSGAQNFPALTALKIEAKTFNDNVAIVLKARQQQNRWARLVNEVYGAASSILLDRLFIQSPSEPITINARADNEQEALAFKNRLESIQNITKVDLPLASVSPTPGDKVGFRISFQVKSLNF